MIEEKYKIVFDNGKPYEIIVNSEEELKTELKKFHLENKDNDDYFNAIVYNDKDEDISESQFIEEIIRDIIEDNRE